MDIKLAKKKIEELSKILRYHDYLYHVKDEPIISDENYDSLFKELLHLEEQYPDLQEADSPTKRMAGDVLSEFESYPHKTPMLSLSNAFSLEELDDFEKRCKKIIEKNDQLDYAVSPKIDGLAIEIIYQNGCLIRALTRGNGMIGEDVTHNIKTIKSIPLRLESDLNNYPVPEVLTVRGEIFIKNSDFEALNKKRLSENLEPFANPRNAAAGAIRQLDSKNAAERQLCFYAHSAGFLTELRTSLENTENTATNNVAIESEYDFWQYLSYWHFPVAPKLARVSGIDQLKDIVNSFDNERKNLNFAVDGLVIKIDSWIIQKHIGVVSKHPRWAIAYKYSSLEVKTQIVDIIIQVGRTGAITPVAVLKPVFVGGVEVSRATLHNEDEIRRKDIKIKDFVMVRRAGEVIPEIAYSLANLRTGVELDFVFPTNCPICHSGLEKNPDEAVLRCINNTCTARLKGLLRHFASKQAMDIDGMGEKLIDQLVDKNKIKDISDIYTLTKEDLSKLDRMADKSAENLLIAIENSKSRPLHSFIFALGIFHVGEQSAKILSNAFGSLTSLMSATEERLLEIYEIGPAMAKSVVNFFSQPQTKYLVDKLLYLGVLAKNDSKNQNDTTSEALKGKTFVITGSLSNYTREEAANLILAHGGQVSGSVSKKTYAVVVGINPGSKAEKAIALGVKLIEENEFLSLFTF